MKIALRVYLGQWCVRKYIRLNRQPSCFLLFDVTGEREKWKNGVHASVRLAANIFNYILSFSNEHEWTFQIPLDSIYEIDLFYNYGEWHRAEYIPSPVFPLRIILNVLHSPLPVSCIVYRVSYKFARIVRNLFTHCRLQSCQNIKQVPRRANSYRIPISISAKQTIGQCQEWRLENAAPLTASIIQHVQQSNMHVLEFA